MAKKLATTPTVMSVTGTMAVELAVALATIANNSANADTNKDGKISTSEVFASGIQSLQPGMLVIANIQTVSKWWLKGSFRDKLLAIAAFNQTFNLPKDEAERRFENAMSGLVYLEKGLKLFYGAIQNVSLPGTEDETPAV